MWPRIMDLVLRHSLDQRYMNSSDIYAKEDLEKYLLGNVCRIDVQPKYGYEITQM
jgi:hypothetical protein